MYGEDNCLWQIDENQEGEGVRKPLLTNFVPRWVRVSPNGEYVAFASSRLDTEQDRYVDTLVIAPTDGSSRMRFVNQCEFPVHWSSEGNCLLAILEGEATVVECFPDRRPSLITFGLIDSASWASWSRGGEGIVTVRDGTELWETSVETKESRKIYEVK